MEFADLPWFVREYIIKQVIEEQPKYCRVNKEWFRLVTAKHGLLYFGRKAPEINNSNTLLTPHIKKVEFTRTLNIDWDFVYSKKNITDLSIELSFLDEIFDIGCEVFIKHLQLPPLRSLDVSICGISRFNFNLLIANSQLHLERLRISTVSQPLQFTTEKMTLPNLVHLDLANLRKINIRKITKGMPSLDSLCLSFYKPEVSILFRGFKMANLTKLDLRNFNREISIKVNLSNLPNIKNLTLMGEFKITGKHVFNKVEELKAKNTPKYFLNLIYPRFPKLKALNLTITDDLNLPDLWNLLQRLTTQTKVYLSLEFRYTFNNLLPGPYDITYLVLNGGVYTNSYLLRWLSGSFGLQMLDLHACNLSELVYQDIPKFKQLIRLRLRVRTDSMSILNRVFNKRTHPHIISIEVISCDCAK